MKRVANFQEVKAPQAKPGAVACSNLSIPAPLPIESLPTSGWSVEAAKTIEVEGNYWRRRVLEALNIHQRQQTSNLNCGLTINPSWLPVLNQPLILLQLPHYNITTFLSPLKP